ncbi:MAG: hypothetical protein AAF958_14220 [Planctomycetota bacterium]
MKSFVDTSGRTWSVAIGVPAVRRLRDEMNFDVLSLLDDQSKLEIIAADPMIAIDLVTCIIKPQLDAAGVAVDDFLNALGGEQLESATSCLLQAIVDFFPGPRGELLRKALQRSQKFIQDQDQQIKQKIQSGEVEQAIDEALAAASTAGKS